MPSYLVPPLGLASSCHTILSSTRCSESLSSVLRCRDFAASLSFFLYHYFRRATLCFSGSLALSVGMASLLTVSFLVHRVHFPSNRRKGKCTRSSSPCAGTISWCHFTPSSSSPPLHLKESLSPLAPRMADHSGAHRGPVQEEARSSGRSAPIRLPVHGLYRREKYSAH